MTPLPPFLHQTSIFCKHGIFIDLFTNFGLYNVHQASGATHPPAWLWIVMRTKLISDGSQHSFELWLKRKRATAVGLNFVMAAACFIGGVAILAMIFFLTYAVVWFGYNYGVSAASELIIGRHQHISHTGILIVCWCVVGLLFVENIRVRQDYWSGYTMSGTRWSFLWLAGVLGSLVALVANAHASARMITDILLTGPRLIGACARAIYRAFLLMTANLETLLDAFCILATGEAPVSVAGFNARLQGRYSDRVLSELEALEAIFYTRRDPLTIALDPEIREQIKSFPIYDSIPEGEKQAESTPVGAFPEDDGLFGLLGLAPSASLEQVRAAFRRRMKACHPDVFAGHSEDERRIAEEKTKQILAAYERLLAKLRGNKNASSRYGDTPSRG